MKLPDISPVYQPRKPQESQYYRCVEDNFETLEQVYDERFAKQYAFFMQTPPFLSILPPEVVVEFGEWLCEEVLKAVPHRHRVAPLC